MYQCRLERKTYVADVSSVEEAAQEAVRQLSASYPGGVGDGVYKVSVNKMGTKGWNDVTVSIVKKSVCIAGGES